MIGLPHKSFTPGESRLKHLLGQLNTDDYWFIHEPHVHTADGQSSKPDFVIVNRRLGVIIVEVKDWNHIERGDQQSITTRRFDGEIKSYPNPVLTVERFAYHLKQRFEERAELWQAYRGRQTLRFPWQVLVVLPYISQSIIEQFEGVGIWPRGVVIGRELLESPISLDQIIQHLPWRFRLTAPIPNTTLDVIRETLQPSLIVETKEGNPLGTLTAVQDRLISEPLTGFKPRQLPLLSEDFLPEDTTQAAIDQSVRLVRGVAGSGKTLVLVRRVQQLVRQHPEARQLVLTFNVDIATDLRQRIGRFNNVEVMNFHRLCRLVMQPYWADPLRAVDWLRRYTIERLRLIDVSADYAASEFGWRKELGLYDSNVYLHADRRGRGKRLDRHQREEIDLLFSAYLQAQSTLRAKGVVWFDWDDVPFLTLEALENHPLQHHYDALFVDEAQDFAPSWIQVCRKLVKTDGDLFLCDDPSQSIFCSYTWSQKGLNIVGHSRVLRVPFRSTKAINRAAHSLIEADETLRSQDDRPRPDLEAEGLQDGPLPLLLTTPLEASEAAWIHEHIQKLLAEGIAPQQIAILCHNRWHLRNWDSWSKRGVYVQHFDRMKGLEFHAVVIPHLHTAFTTPLDQDNVAMVRRKLFTAMTRARYRLALSCTGTLPSPLIPLIDYVQQQTITPHVGD